MKLSHAITLAVAALFVFAACGGDGPGDPSPTATVPADASETPVPATATPQQPTATATVTPTPVPADAALVQQLGRSASYIIYTASEGDTLPHVARVFGGVPGPDGTLVAFLAELQELNQLSGWDLEPGQTVAIPLLPESTGIPAASMESLWLWLTVGGVKGLELYAPGDRLINDGYQGSLVVQSIELFLDVETDEVIGYSFEYAETDRPVFKGGELDAAAVVVGRAFRLSCGSVGRDFQSSGGETFAELGSDCTVSARRGDLDAETISGLLVLVRMFVD